MANTQIIDPSFLMLQANFTHSKPAYTDFTQQQTAFSRSGYETVATLSTDPLDFGHLFILSESVTGLSVCSRWLLAIALHPLSLYFYPKTRGLCCPY